MSKSEKFTLEFIIRSSAKVLYDFLITPTGLSQWFADQVDNEGNTYFFTWDSVEDQAELISTDDDDFIRFQWDYQDEDEYFEFRIEKGEITGDTILYVTDFADPSEVESQKQLWQSQIKELSKRIGAS
ncbi:MAG TPA: ATPase [Bacteroidetes bacterium]|jgi:uncharacterized protein YndB with AHSA1/START domain|nr:MAG: ATPase [Sphingobacteriales bacterium BACL12 MAG-120802-bin5]KRP13327.1 MAG: ATPase [Sphingobacteriales bacterium BACL12 MAG-120813-bin55]HCK21403.1 ATPase [Bacteroidota bacterium]